VLKTDVVEFIAPVPYSPSNQLLFIQAARAYRT
jgi:hypothetical protein